MSTTGSGTERIDALRLPADEESGPLFRQYVRLACHQTRHDDILDRVLLVTDELVGNAIRHAANPGERFVELALVPTGHGLRVRVSDGDPTPPVPRQLAVDGTAGRGLHVVASIAAAWGTDVTATGKTIWADIDPE